MAEMRRNLVWLGAHSFTKPMSEGEVLEYEDVQPETVPAATGAGAEQAAEMDKFVFFCGFF